MSRILETIGNNILKKIIEREYMSATPVDVQLKEATLAYLSKRSRSNQKLAQLLKCTTNDLTRFIAGNGSLRIDAIGRLLKVLGLSLIPAASEHVEFERQKSLRAEADHHLDATRDAVCRDLSHQYRSFFQPGTPVIIHGDREAVIISFLVEGDPGSVSYKVRYLNSGAIVESWVHEFEFEPRNGSDKSFHISLR